MSTKFDDDLFEDVPYQVSESEMDESLFEDEPISTGETMALGAAQGLTFDFADEVAGAIGGTWDYLTTDEKKTLVDEYKEDRDAFRRRVKLAQEQNPVTYYGSDIGAGIIPAFFTGGATAAAKIGTSLAKGATKEALKQAVKQGAKTGAKYGAAVGLGASEADLTEGEVAEAAKDTAIGVGTGAALGGALPVAAKGLKESGKYVGEKGKDLVKTIVPDSDLIEASYKFGKQGKKLTEDAIDQDMIDTGTQLYNKLIKAKKNNNLKEVRDELDALGYKADIKVAVDDAIEDFEKMVDNDFLDLNNKDVINRLKVLSGKAVEEADDALLEKATEKAALKRMKSQNKGKEALIKSEKKMAKDQMLSNSEIVEQDELYGVVDDIPGSVLTEEGQILGKSAEFETPDGEKFTKKYLEDVTEYQPQIKKGRLDSGKPVAVIEDVGSGKLETIVGKAQKTIEQDLEELSINEAEALRAQLNQLIEESIKGGKSTRDPVLNRAKLLASEIKDIVDKVVAEGGNESLIKRRAKISDLLTAEELVGIKNNLSRRGDINKEKKIQQLADRFGYSKGFKARQEGKTAERLLGKDVMTPELGEQFDLLKKVNVLLGRESQENISKAGLYKKAVGDLPNAIGRVNSAVSNNKLVKGAKSATNFVMNLPDKALALAKDKMIASPRMGVQALGLKLEEALQQEATKRNATLFALQQNPAFRQAVREMVSENDEAMMGDLAPEEEQGRDIELPTIEEPLDVGRSPQGETVEEEPLEASDEYLEELNQSKVDPNPQGREPSGDEPQGKDDVENIYKKLAKDFPELTKEDIALIGGLESAHNKYKDAKNSSAKGLFQFIDGTRESIEARLKKKGIKFSKDPYDLNNQYLYMKELLNDNLKSIKKFDDDPDIYGLYAMHLLGSSRGKKLLTSDNDSKVSDILPSNVISANKALLGGNKTVSEAKSAIKKYLEKRGGSFNFSSVDFKQDVLPELEEKAQEVPLDQILQGYANQEIPRPSLDPIKLDKVKQNVLREKADIASGGEGYERVTIDDLMGSIFDLELDEETENAMLDAAYNGNMAELEKLLKELE